MKQEAVVREQVGAVEGVVGPRVDAPTPRATAEPTPEALEAWAEWFCHNDVLIQPSHLHNHLVYDASYLLREIARRLRDAQHG